jgi:hypothetical protein
MRTSSTFPVFLFTLGIECNHEAPRMRTWRFMASTFPVFLITLGIECNHEAPLYSEQAASTSLDCDGCLQAIITDHDRPTAAITFRILF